MNRKSLRTAGVATATAALLFGLSACGDNNSSSSGDSSSSSLSGTINGIGSSAQQAAVTAWQQGFQTANSKVTVNYDPQGSGAGRKQFIAGAADFAGSDAYMTADELSQAKTKCGSDVVEVPVYISPIAVAFNLKGVKKLNLSADVIAKIFSGKITSWNDAAIKAENPSATLPSTKITTVHRSDDSGTTQNFTDYLHQAAPTVWSAEGAQTWPFKTGEAAKGTSGVVQAIKSGNGTIGYADESQVGGLGITSVKVGSAYVAPSADAATKAADEAKAATGSTDTVLAYDVDRTTTSAGVYPVILISYQIACQKPSDAAKGKVIKAWLKYVVSNDGQSVGAKAAGSAPLPSSIATKAQSAVDSMK